MEFPSITIGNLKKHRDDEKWVPFKDCPHFLISNSGRLYNTRTNHERKLTSLTGGYLGFTLFRGTKSYRMHDCVIKHFGSAPPTSGRRQVNHLDFNRQNNNDWNLEWLTDYQNIRYSVDNNRFTKGSSRYGAKLNELQVSIIKEAFDKGYKSYRDIAKYFNVNHATIYNICNRKKWIHVKAAA